jgi:hypothetical protein
VEKEGRMTIATNTMERTVPSPERLQDLVRRAQGGDRSAMPELRQVLDADPSLWQRYGDLAKYAQGAWLQLVAPRDVLLYECLERKMEELRAELSGPDPSPLEKLLVERVVACWLQCEYADILYAQNRDQPSSVAIRKELMARQESAQRRYLASMKQLATVRKLLKPGLSPFDLAMRPVEEGNPAVRGRAAAAPPLRVAAVN